MPFVRPRLLAPFLLVLLVIASTGMLAGTQDSTVREYRVEVLLARPAEQLAELRALDLYIDYFDIKTGAAYLIVTEGQLHLLRSMGLEPVVLEDVTSTAERIEALSDYVDETESDAAINQAASDYPDIAMRLEYAYLTEEGRTTGLLKVSDNVATDEPEPRILFVSQHHANEVMTPEVMVDMIEYLTQNYGIDPEVTEWVDRYEIYIIPCHNPDGTHYAFNFSSGWRKNRHDNGDGSFGVDLNRNYDYRWGPEGCGGSSGSPSSTTYRGPSAASEPETQSINVLALDVHPSISLTYHTSGQYVLLPFGCSPNLPDDPDRRIHRDTGSMLGAVIENDARNGWYRMGTPPELLYSVDGGSDDWLHAIAGTVAFTIEMNTSQQPDYATWRDDTVLRNREGWKYLIRRLAGPSIGGRIRDACTDAGVAAEVGLVEQLFTQDQDPRTAVPGHGFYHRILMPGEFTWYAESAGYRRQEWPIAVRFSPVPLDIWLVPEGSHALAARSLAVDDTGGDIDGQLDPGEEADLLLTALATGEAVTGVTATLTTDDVYLEVLDGTAFLPDLAAGAEGAALDPFRVRVLGDAPDGHTAMATITLTANEVLCRDTSPMELHLTRGFPSCPFEQETLDQDPGWTITGPSGGWEYGLPKGSGGNDGPPSAHSGDNVYGTDLEGNYGTTAGEFVLTSTPFDLQGLRDAELRFWRWLNNEPGDDLARIEVSVDEETWTEVWRGFGRDTRWEEYRVDLPSEVDDADQVWVRFILVQDGGVSRSGLYLDDIAFCGEAALSAAGKLKYDAYTLSEDDPNYGNTDGALDNGETVTMAVTVRSTRSEEAHQVSALLTTSDSAVTINNQVALYPDVVAGGVAESLSPHFSFTTGPDCGDKIPFTLEVRYEDGLSTLSHFTVPVGTTEPATLMTDDMEEDQGWTVSGDATEGHWERDEPFPSVYEQEWTNPNEDHTPDPGVACWATQNVQPPTVVPPTSAEVDDGSTILTSPPLAAGDFQTLELSYWRWFYTGGGPGPDSYRVEATSDGSTYHTVEEVGTKANQWIEARHELSEVVDLTDDLLVRVVVTDGGGESIVEGGLDDLELAGDRLICEPFTPPLLDPPNSVGDTLMAGKLGWDVRLDWQAPPTDPGHGPATLYRVSRSEEPDTGFGEIGAPTAPRHFDASAAGPSAPDLYCYLVSAENSGGSE